MGYEYSVQRRDAQALAYVQTAERNRFARNCTKQQTDRIPPAVLARINDMGTPLTGDQTSWLPVRQGV